MCSEAYYLPGMTTITCKITEELDARLATMARRERVSKSQILREALESSLTRSKRTSQPRAIDLVRHLRGTLRGPSDLATDPKHMKGYGE
jgi:hypothetical protein